MEKFDEICLFVCVEPSNKSSGLSNIRVGVCVSGETTITKNTTRSRISKLVKSQY